MDVASFVIGAGLRRSGNSFYSFKKYDEILRDICSFRDDASELPSQIDYGLIDEIFIIQQEAKKQHDIAKRPTLDEIGEMSVQELFEFKNQLAAEVVSQEFKKNCTSGIIGENGDAEIYFKGKDFRRLRDKINKSDNSEELDLEIYDRENESPSTISKKISGVKTKVSDLPKAFALLKRIGEIINTRVIVDSEKDRA